MIQIKNLKKNYRHIVRKRMNSALNIPQSLIRIYEKKLTTINDGNISVKLANKKYFHITPSGMKKHHIKESDLVSVNFSNNIYSVNDLDRIPSRELDLHAKLIMNSGQHEDCCVVHCHPQNVLAYIGLTDHKQLSTIQYLFPEISFKIGQNVKFHPAGTMELANQTYTNIHNENNDIVALENHGVVARGTNLEAIIDMIEIIDYYCEIALKDNIILLDEV